MTRRSNTDEFRGEAVKLTLTSKLLRSQVTEDLGIGSSMLGKCQGHQQLVREINSDVKPVERLFCEIRP